MKIGFWLIPKGHEIKNEQCNYKGFYWLWWHFITKSKFKSNFDNLKK